MPPRKRRDRTAEITCAEWDRIAEVYRKHNGPGNAVANELGWLIARVHRCWKRGLPSKGFPPIRQMVLTDELSTQQIRTKRAEMMESQAVLDGHVIDFSNAAPAEVEAKAEVIHAGEQARLAELVRLEEERRKAREDALTSKAEEALLVSLNRRNTIALNGMTSRLMKGAVALSESIQGELERVAKTRAPLDVKLKLIRSAASIARFNAEATMLTVKAERMVLGQPIEAPPDTPNDGSLEQAVEWIEAASLAVKRARQRGLLMTGSSSGSGNGTSTSTTTSGTSEVIPPEDERH